MAAAAKERGHGFATLDDPSVYVRVIHAVKPASASPAAAGGTLVCHDSGPHTVSSQNFVSLGSH